MLAGLTTTTMIMIDADHSNERQPVYLAEIGGVLYCTDCPIYPPSLCLWSLTQDYNRWLKRRLVSDSLFRASTFQQNSRDKKVIVFIVTFLVHAKLGVQSQKLGVQLHPLLQRRTATEARWYTTSQVLPNVRRSTEMSPYRLHYVSTSK